jgi:hypothetical protein
VGRLALICVEIPQCGALDATLASFDFPKRFSYKLDGKNLSFRLTPPNTAV